MFVSTFANKLISEFVWKHVWKLLIRRLASLFTSMFVNRLSQKYSNLSIFTSSLWMLELVSIMLSNSLVGYNLEIYIFPRFSYLRLSPHLKILKSLILSRVIYVWTSYPRSTLFGNFSSILPYPSIVYAISIRAYI